MASKKTPKTKPKTKRPTTPKKQGGRKAKPSVRARTTTAKSKFKQSKAEQRPEILVELLAVTKAGGDKERASAVAGISRVTFDEWLRWGQQFADEIAAGVTHPDRRMKRRQRIFAKFWQDYLVASTENEAYMLKVVKTVARSRDPRTRLSAATWWLEHLHPLKYAKRQQLEHSGEGVALTVPSLLAELGDEELEDDDPDDNGT